MASTANENKASTPEMSAAELLAEKHQTFGENETPEGAGEGGESSSWGKTMSTKAAGKRPEANTPKAAINTESHELFPSLGNGPVPASNKPPSKWGPSNGTNGAAATNGGAQAAAPVARGSTKPAMVIPGRNVESIIIEKQHILPREKLKRPIPDIIKDINRKSRANITMASASGGRHRFDATGPRDVAQQALKDLVQQIGTRATISVAIPQSSRAHIIGKGGSTVKAIQERTGARINFPKLDESHAGLDDDDDAEIQVTIEGNTISAASAREEILKIVNERSANVQTKLRGIPSVFYPFIAGRGNADVTAMEDKNHVQIRIPPLRPLSSEPIPTEDQPTFAPSDDSHIQIAGDRAAVQKTRAEMERLASELQKKLQVRNQWINQGTHQFIIGQRGIPMEDFFAETGCVVLLPSDDETHDVAVVGPEQCLAAGLKKATELAGEMRSYAFDLARGVPNGPVHARNMTRYLRQQGEIERLEKAYNTIINTPATTSSWEIYSRDSGSANKTQAEIAKLMAGHPPSRTATVSVDPFFHSHLQKNIARSVRESYGVQVVVPEPSDAGAAVVLVYEAPFEADVPYVLPTTKPSKADVDKFQQGLRNAQEYIVELIKKQEEILSASVDVPHKFHERLRRFIKKEQENRPEDQIPVRVSSVGTKVTFRGPASAVKGMTGRVETFIEQEKEDDKERGFTMSFEFPQRFANHLIGKGGSHIRELRDKFDVEIQVGDGKVELKGPKAKAEAAKSHILSLGRTLADETTHTLKIDPKFHRELIGAQGAQINRLQTRYKVHIFFPRSAKAADENDGASEAGKPRRQQAADEVVIRGPKKGADDARDELFDLFKWAKDHSVTATVTVQQKQIPSLIGQGGAALEDLRMLSGAKIDIPADRDVEMVDIHVRGTQAQVTLAKKELEAKKAVFDNTVIKTIDVDPKFHRDIIGPGGSHLREMVAKAGGSDDRREINRTINIPKADSGSSTIKLEGRTEVVEKILADIKEKVSLWESQVSEVVDVPVEKHRTLIGRGGNVKRQMQDQFKVSIDIPRQGENKTGITITGRPENVKSTKEHIENLVKEQEGETVQVPKALHHAISNNGQFFRNLRKDCKVTVDHAGQPIPPKPEPTRANGGTLPLITDEADTAADAHSWSVVQNTSAAEGEIPWVIRGSADNITEAKKRIAEALEQAKKSDTTGMLTLSDPSTYRLVVGAGGSKVNAIRKQSGCRINVPRGHEPIEIVGSKDGVEKAKELILQAVKEGMNRGRD